MVKSGDKAHFEELARSELNKNKNLIEQAIKSRIEVLTARINAGDKGTTYSESSLKEKSGMSPEQIAMIAKMMKQASNNKGDKLKEDVKHEKAFLDDLLRNPAKLENELVKIVQRPAYNLSLPHERQARSNAIVNSVLATFRDDLAVSKIPDKKGPKSPRTDIPDDGPPPLSAMVIDTSKPLSFEGSTAVRKGETMTEAQVRLAREADAKHASVPSPNSKSHTPFAERAGNQPKPPVDRSTKPKLVTHAAAVTHNTHPSGGRGH